MKVTNTCKIVPVEKRRDGGTRYWCLTHKADATAKYGIPATNCRYAHVPLIHAQDKLELNINKYQAGVAIWGAVPPIYDTTCLSPEKGIHVHARSVPGTKKEIDDSFRSVRLIASGGEFEIHELDAIYFMVSSIFRKRMKYIACPNCNWPHLDKDWFSVHPHKRHRCSGCGKNFRDNEVCIGNPIMEFCHLLQCPQRKIPQISNRRLDIKQSDYPGGIQIWGSNPAILWTGEQHEVSGIHVHLYSDNGTTRVIDDTFGTVIIDNVKIEPDMVRKLMAQTCLPHLSSRIMSLNCNDCGEYYFDEYANAYSPSVVRECQNCKNLVTSNSRIRKVVSNPLVKIFNDLAKNSINPRQIHNMDLIPECPF